MYRRRGYHNRLERLIQEDELPEIFTQEEQIINPESAILDFGRGRRARDDVNYDDDGLTDEQWLDVCHIIFNILFIFINAFIFIGYDFRHWKEKKIRQKLK